MQFVASVRERAAVGRAVRGRQAPVLSMYDTVQSFEKMSLDQFAKLGWDRVRVLQKFDELGGKDKDENITEVERNSELSAVVKKHLRAKAPRQAIKSHHFDAGQLVLNNELKDVLSHFVVRLASVSYTHLTLPTIYSV